MKHYVSKVENANKWAVCDDSGKELKVFDWENAAIRFCSELNTKPSSIKAPSYPHMTVDLKSVEVDGENAAFNLVNGCEYIGLNIRLEFAMAQCTATVHGLAPYDDRDYTVFYDEPSVIGNAEAVNWSDDVFAVQDMPVELTFEQAVALNEHLDNLAQDKAKELAACA